jgi:hypothetical protein
MLKDELEACPVMSESWTSAPDRQWGGKPFARWGLYLMLQNRIYRGEIVPKKQSKPGEHTPIIDQPVWDPAQGQVAGNATQRNPYGPRSCGGCVSARGVGMHLIARRSSARCADVNQRIGKGIDRD